LFARFFVQFGVNQCNDAPKLVLKVSSISSSDVQQKHRFYAPTHAEETVMRKKCSICIKQKIKTENLNLDFVGRRNFENADVCHSLRGGTHSGN
jgi:hypothetical protein